MAASKREKRGRNVIWWNASYFSKASPNSDFSRTCPQPGWLEGQAFGAVKAVYTGLFSTVWMLILNFAYLVVGTMLRTQLTFTVKIWQNWGTERLTVVSKVNNEAVELRCWPHNVAAGDLFVTTAVSPLNGTSCVISLGLWDEGHPYTGKENCHFIFLNSYHLKRIASEKKCFLFVYKKNFRLVIIILNLRLSSVWILVTKETVFLQYLTWDTQN